METGSQEAGRGKKERGNDHAVSLEPTRGQMQLLARIRSVSQSPVLGGASEFHILARILARVPRTPWALPAGRFPAPKVVRMDGETRGGGRERGRKELQTGRDRDRVRARAALGVGCAARFSGPDPASVCSLTATGKVRGRRW